MSTLTLPDLAGSRASAALLAEQLPESLVDARVVIDVSNVASASQSYVDELCKQILEVRQAALLVVRNASPRFGMHLNTSARLRDVAERLQVDIRAE